MMIAVAVVDDDDVDDVEVSIARNVKPSEGKGAFYPKWQFTRRGVACLSHPFKLHPACGLALHLRLDDLAGYRASTRSNIYIQNACI